MDETALVQKLELAQGGISQQLEGLMAEHKAALVAAQREHEMELAALESRLRGQHAKVMWVGSLRLPGAQSCCLSRNVRAGARNINSSCNTTLSWHHRLMNAT